MLSSIPVNWIRQWCFCPRIVYYIELTNFPVSYPTWVRQGEAFHKREAKLWQRRNLTRFGMAEGEISFEFSALSKELGLHGIIDMVIQTGKEIFPVEFKLASSQQKRGGILQLVAYANILREFTQKKCSHGFLTEGEKNLHKIEISRELTGEMLDVVKEIRKMLKAGIKPDSSASETQCTNCEYLNHCNDRF